MKSTNPQSLDQHADRPRTAVGNASQRPLRRSSQPKFVLQPVVLDDAALPEPHNQRLESEATEANTERDAMVADTYQRASVVTSDTVPDAGSQQGASADVNQARTELLERRVSPPGRSAIIGALFVCGVIAIALFVTLLLTGRAPVV